MYILYVQRDALFSFYLNNCCFSAHPWRMVVTNWSILYWINQQNLLKHFNGDIWKIFNKFINSERKFQWRSYIWNIYNKFINNEHNRFNQHAHAQASIRLTKDFNARRMRKTILQHQSELAFVVYAIFI